MVNIEDIHKSIDVSGNYELVKIESKNGSRVGPRYKAVGTFSLIKIKDGSYRVLINGYGGVMTSEVIKVLDHTDDSVLFETHGGIYHVRKVNV